MTSIRKGWLLFAVLLGLSACDAGPSAVLKDGEGKAASQPVTAERETSAEPPEAQPEKRTLPEAQAAGDAAPISGQPLPIAEDRAVITATHYGDWPLWSSNRKYSTEENARYHFIRHGPEFGANAFEDYMAMVHGFIHSPPEGTQTLRRNNGDTLFYDPKTNVFAVMTRKGAPRTMFRPDDGPAYWERQKIIEAGRRTVRREAAE